MPQRNSHPPTPPPPRLGPRPLPMHLGLAAWTWTTSRAALPLLKSGSLDWKPRLSESAASLRQRLNDAPSNGFDAAVDAEIRRRLGDFLAGIEAYRRHPWRRDVADPPVLWREGTTRMFDYDAGGAGSVVLIVPSLVNRFHVLDLSSRCSLIRHLAEAGLRPLVIDWDRPGPAEREFDLSDYIAGRLERALDAARAAAGGKVAVIGYCMGGNLALALALRRHRDISRLALLATPWDFHADDAAAAKALATGVAPFWPVVEQLGEMPTDLIQVLFCALDPYLAVKKFLAFGRLDPESAKAAHFVALEDWLNDGVPLAARVARECLDDWYGRNTPGAGQWRVAGAPIRPAELRLPTLGIVPGADRIVPPASAAALIDAIPGAAKMTPPLGHIGMVVGHAGPEAVWAPLTDWVRHDAA
ncbi:MAG: alpha/beta fold hydrolase [Alphaproteobacteria bacterium]|nr:alpha/beta fold hydrolase [Alphaproteobacteria bacterium]